MKKRLIAHMTVLMLTVSMLSGLFISVGASDGRAVTYARDLTSNSSQGTYYVETAADLAQMATLVNAGHSLKGFTFLQTKNIDLSGVDYTPIGTYNVSATTAFRGTYDGQCYVITNFKYYDETRDGAGIFGHLNGATVKNLGIESGSVTAANRAGAIAGYADGSDIINCYNKASITILTGTDGVGGIAGVARGSANFYGCYNAGTVTCVTTAAAGIVGWAGKGDNSMLIGCYNAGALKYSGTLSTVAYALDPIARNTQRTMGDFSSCYYLAGCCKDAAGNDLSDTYNAHKAIRLEKEDATLMAYVLNHATGADTNAFTVKNGKIAFSSANTDGVTDLQIKAVRDGVLLSDTGIQRELTGGYTVPATYESYEVLSAKAGEKTYVAGDFIPSETAGILTVELTLAGDYPSVTDYEKNKDATVFTVANAKELAKLADLVDAGNTFEGKTVYVTADLDFSAYSVWNGIGECAGTGGGNVAEGAKPFSGTFDGQYHHFKNINVRRNVRYGGIFSFAQNAIIQNIILDEGTVHCIGANGRVSGALAGAIAGTQVQNIENHVSVYADQTEFKADNLGLVGMSVDGSVISNCVNYGEVGYEGKTNLQENGSFVGYGYGETTVTNCIAVGKVTGEGSDPVARGCTVSNNYYLPHGETAGTMTYETLLSGEAAMILNTKGGAQIWSKGPEGPALDPSHPVGKATYVLNETDQLLSGTVTAYHNVGQSASLPTYPGFTLLNGSKELWPLADSYTMPHFEQTIQLYYSHKAYKITYVTNGGIFVNGPETVAIGGQSYALPTKNDIERTGYAFTGWYTNEDLSGTPVTATPVDEYHDVIYYAGWKALTKISTAKQLAAMKPNGSYVLTADIDMSGTAFSPIGTYETPFTGTFDGDGHTISGLTIDSTENYQGLFGVNEGLIKNVVLDDDCTVKGNAYVGGIAGENFGQIENCISRAAIQGNTAQKSVGFKLFVQNLRLVVAGEKVDRRVPMKERIDSKDPDIMLLQEANEPWIEFLNTNYVNTGAYGMIYKYRATNDKEGVPVLYKKSKFTLVESGNFWLSATPDKASAPEGYSHYRICSWAVLKEKSTARYVMAFSVHLDTGGNEVRIVNAQALRDRFDTIRAKYASYDPICIIAGDFNARKGTDPYNILCSGDMVNTIYEITSGLTPANIDHILISENNCRALDSTFEYLPVTDAENRVPSDHQGLYTEMRGMIKSRMGGIAGSNSGTVRNSVGEAVISSGHYNFGTLTGRNLGNVENSYYTPQTDVSPLGNSISITAPTEMTSAGAAAYALNDGVVQKRFTVTSGKIDLLSAGEAPSCIASDGTVKSAHTLGKAKTVAATCTEAGYTGKTCSVCGYLEKTAETPATGHSFGALTSVNTICHQKACATCKAAVYADHTYTSESVAAGCGTYGGTRYTCGCGYSYLDQINDDSKSPIWGTYAQKDGEVHQQVCTRDGAHTLEKAHVYSATSVAPTCETAGKELSVCDDCGYGFETSVGNPLGHAYGKWTKLDEKQHQAVCDRDGSHLTQADHIMKAGETTAPTCEEQGYTLYGCTECAHSEQRDFTPALGHTYGYDAEAKEYLCHCSAAYVADGDANGDGAVNTADIVAVLRRVDGNQKSITADYTADMDKDGRIALWDAILFVRNFLVK